MMREMNAEANGIILHFGSKEIMRITRDGIWVNPDISVDDAATAVLAAIDTNIFLLLEAERERERERCAQLCDAEVVRLGQMDEALVAAICAAAIRGMK